MQAEQAEMREERKAGGQGGDKDLHGQYDRLQRKADQVDRLKRQRIDILGKQGRHKQEKPAGGE